MTITVEHGPEGFEFRATPVDRRTFGCAEDVAVFNRPLTARVKRPRPQRFSVKCFLTCRAHILGSGMGRGIAQAKAISGVLTL